MERKSAMAPLNLTTTTSGVGIRVPEPPITELQCPKCGAENVGRKTHVWRVADERGVHHECQVCAHAWR